MLLAVMMLLGVMMTLAVAIIINIVIVTGSSPPNNMLFWFVSKAEMKSSCGSGLKHLDGLRAICVGFRCDVLKFA